MNYYAHQVNTDDSAAVTVYSPGEDPLIANDGHPQFETILEAIGSFADYETLRDLFSPARGIAHRFENLTERVSIADGQVFFDGDAVDNSITDHIVRTLNEQGDFDPLVSFLEKVMTNLESHSRDQLFRWLQSKDFTITEAGDIVGYKALRPFEGGFSSISQGHAIVDGEEILYDCIPQGPGSVVEMPRSEVQHDPHTGCAPGLHVGTYDYALMWGSNYGGSVVAEVIVNPRDVVSVPNGEAQKMRCCRYIVGEIVGEAYTTAIWPVEDDTETVDADSVLSITHPTESEFTVMQQRAKRRRRNFIAYAEKMGPWTLTDSDNADDRLSWENA